MSELFPLQSSPPASARLSVAVACPVSGKPVSITALGDPLLASGIWGHGSALTTSSSQILAPISGKIVRTDPLAYAVILQAKNGLLLRIKMGVETAALMAEKCHFQVTAGAKVKHGQLLFSVTPPFFKRCGVEAVCIVTVMNSDKLTAVVPNTLSHCRALDDTLFTVYA